MTDPIVTSSPKEDRVTLTLKADPSGELLMRSVEVVSAQSRVRFTFPPDEPLKKCLADKATQEITALVGSALEYPGLYAKPDHVIRLPRLILADANVIIADVQDGGQQVMVRFNRHYGDFLTLFADGTYARERLGGGMVGYAIEALEKAYIPLLDFAEHVNQLQSSGLLQPGEQTSDALLAISDRIQNMQVYGAMVRQIVTGDLEAPAVIERIERDLSPEERDAQDLRRMKQIAATAN
ncbi:MAG: hypothetical protein AAGF90_03500 [Pseudomonadota bacterium]